MTEVELLAKVMEFARGNEDNNSYSDDCHLCGAWHPKTGNHTTHRDGCPAVDVENLLYWGDNAAYRRRESESVAAWEARVPAQHRMDEFYWEEYRYDD